MTYQRLLSLFLITALMACNDKEAKIKLALKSATEALSINYIIGIGQTIPEKDIISLSSIKPGLKNRKSIPSSNYFKIWLRPGRLISFTHHCGDYASFTKSLILLRFQAS